MFILLGVRLWEWSGVLTAVDDEEVALPPHVHVAHTREQEPSHRVFVANDADEGTL